MSVIETNVVDAIGTDKLTGNIILSITDHLDWNDEYNHLAILQEKINSYLSFIESREVYEAYPASKAKNFEILIYFKYDLSCNAKKFLDVAARTISVAGVNLSYKLSR